MENYKDDVRATRRGALGSSDGKLLRQIAELGYVPKSAHRRMAVVNGLCEQEEIPYTAAVRTGDEIEMAIFEHTKAANPLAESNPLVVSEKYSRPHCRLLSHPDIRIVDEDAKCVTYIEVKASKLPTDKVRDEYAPQLYIHTLLAREEAARYGKDWNAKVYLAHFSTEGLDLEQGVEFTTDRLTVQPVRMSRYVFDVPKAMDIVEEFLKDFNEYYGDGEEVDGNLLPEDVRTQFNAVTKALAEIKEREKAVGEFRDRLYRFMAERNIKSIKCEDFSIVRIDDTVSRSFDAKRYMEDFRAQHPRKAKALEAKYTKEVKRKGYANIKLNNKDK